MNRHMIDMLVRLYDLPDSSELYADIAAKGATLRRARAFEKHTVAAFAATFSEKWRSESEVAINRQPVACFIATRGKEIIGFSCYDTTHRGLLATLTRSVEATDVKLHSATLISGRSSTTSAWNWS